MYQSQAIHTTKAGQADTRRSKHPSFASRIAHRRIQLLIGFLAYSPLAAQSQSPPGPPAAAANPTTSSRATNSGPALAPAAPGTNIATRPSPPLRPSAPTGLRIITPEANSIVPPEHFTPPPGFAPPRRPIASNPPVSGTTSLAKTNSAPAPLSPAQVNQAPLQPPQQPTQPIQQASGAANSPTPTTEPHPSPVHSRHKRRAAGRPFTRESGPRSNHRAFCPSPRRSSSSRRRRHSRAYYPNNNRGSASPSPP